MKGGLITSSYIVSTFYIECTSYLTLGSSLIGPNFFLSYTYDRVLVCGIVDGITDLYVV